MNAATVRKHLIESLGLTEGEFTVKGERSGNLRFFTVRLKPSLAGRAAAVKRTVQFFIEERGYSGGCDVLSEFGGKIA